MATNTPLFNPTPKERFQNAPDNISKHRVMVDDNAFQRAMDFALLEYQRVLLANPMTNNSDAMANGYRLQGAQEFMNTVRMLSEKPQAPARTQVQQLDHKV